MASSEFAGATEDRLLLQRRWSFSLVRTSQAVEDSLVEEDNWKKVVKLFFVVGPYQVVDMPQDGSIRAQWDIREKYRITHKTTVTDFRNDDDNRWRKKISVIGGGLFQFPLITHLVARIFSSNWYRDPTFISPVWRVA